MSETIDESVDFAGIQLRNPVLTASGTFGYGTEFAPFLDLEKIGGFVAKSLTLEPRYGNPPPRIAETPAGMLNAISIENVGVRAFLEEKLPRASRGRRRHRQRVWHRALSLCRSGRSSFRASSDRGHRDQCLLSSREGRRH